MGIFSRLDFWRKPRGETRQMVNCRECAYLYAEPIDSNAPDGDVWQCTLAEQVNDPPHLDDGVPSYRECRLYVAKR